MEPEAYPTCRFYVKIGDSTQAVFTEVGGLQRETEVMDYQEGGFNDFVHRLPGPAKPAPNLVLKRGLATSNEFFRWAVDVASGTIEPQNISVVMFDVSGHELMRWNFDNAYPVKWVGPQLNAHEAATAIETLELAYDMVKLG